MSETETSFEVRDVKALEWEQFGDEQFIVDAQLRGGSTAIAQSILGQYQVWGDGSWFAHGIMHHGNGGSLDTGMVAAQADFKERILSAIEWV